MSREEEIRGRLESADPKDWRHHDFGFPSDEEPTSIAIHEGKFDWRAISEGEFIAMLPDADAPDDRNARLIANAPADLTYLLERNAELEATVRAVEELIEPYVTRDAISGSIDETRRVHVRVADLRAALNQGGETNGE